MKAYNEKVKEYSRHIDALEEIFNKTVGENEIYLKTDTFYGQKWMISNFSLGEYKSYRSYDENIKDVISEYERYKKLINSYVEEYHKWEIEYEKNKEPFAKFVENPSPFFVYTPLVRGTTKRDCFSVDFNDTDGNKESFKASMYSYPNGHLFTITDTIHNYDYSVRPMTESEFNEFLVCATAGKQDIKEAVEYSDYLKKLYAQLMR